LTLVNGLLALFRPLSERLPERFEPVLLLANYETLARSLDIFVGVSLIYLSYQILRRRVIAWWLALAASSFMIGLHLSASHWLVASALPLVTVVLLLFTKRYFQARSEPSSIWMGVAGFAISLGLVLLYGIVGFWYMHMRDFGLNFSITNSVTLTMRVYLLIGTSLEPHTRHARWFLDSLRIMGGLTLAFGLYALFRPLEYSIISVPRQRNQMENLLRRHSHSSEDFFKLWPQDKSYFFSSDQQAALAYGVKGSTALVVMDPVGPQDSLKMVVREFQHYCLVDGWSSAYIYVSDKNLDEYQAAGLTVLKIGEDALVNLHRFADSTGRNKHFRNIANRFTKLGHQTEFHNPPHSQELLAAVADVSREWLAQPGRREWRFMTGSYSDRYMQMCQLFVLRDADNRIAAFVNLIPSYARGIATNDLLSRLEGYDYFNLGMAPLSGLDESSNRPEERLLNLIYQSNQKIVSLKGLRQFKSKFEPEWQSKYIAYSGGPARIPRIAYALQKLMK